MRIPAAVLVAIVLALPSFAAGQTGPVLRAPDEDASAAPALVAQGSGGFPPPMPGGRGPGGPMPPGPPPPGPMMGQGPGVWWKNSEVTKRIGLSDAQAEKIEQIFFERRLRLVDLRADLEKQEIRLQPLLDADRPEEAKVAAQIDQITAARGRLEKENALMLLAIRQVLSTNQWKQLQTLQQERAHGPGGPLAGPPGGRPAAGPGRQFDSPPPR